jgi:DMSO/TMAO reductase YedYZ molybdopterin-dependent catalytic subunit
VVTRGFLGRKRPQGDSGRLPPGQYTENGFPVLSAGPTPRTPLETWTFSLETSKGDKLASWSWQEFLALPQTEVHTDIHCVTKWSKFDTDWKGVTVVDLLKAAGLGEPPEPYAMAFSDGGYTTNLPMKDLLNGKSMVAHEYDGEPLRAEHGGPARLFVPHLYFWKSAKWVRGLRFMPEDAPGFWEAYGYHMYGDPWREQRYWSD